MATSFFFFSPHPFHLDSTTAFVEEEEEEEVVSLWSWTS